MEKTFYFKKLVRDNTINLIDTEGGRCKVQELNTQEILTQIKLKILEEIEEVFSATTREEKIEELCDVFEVLKVLMDEFKIKHSEIQSCGQIKNSIRGGFSKRLYIEHATFPKNSKTYNYCLKNSHKYPEKEILN